MTWWDYGSRQQPYLIKCLLHNTVTFPTREFKNYFHSSVTLRLRRPITAHSNQSFWKGIQFCVLFRIFLSQRRKNFIYESNWEKKENTKWAVNLCSSSSKQHQKLVRKSKMLMTEHSTSLFSIIRHLPKPVTSWKYLVRGER